MGRESDLKNLIIDAINSNPSAKKKFNALKKDKLSGILQCYKDSADEYIDKGSRGNNEISRNTNEYMRKIIQEDIIFKPEKTKSTLKSWLEADISSDVRRKIKQQPSEVNFKIKFQEVLDDLQEIE